MKQFAPCGNPIRRRALSAAALLACLLASACEKPVPAQNLRTRLLELERPHVVLFLVDTLRADHTTPYDPKRLTTPELSRWAERGIVFEHVLSQSSWTKISMASLMTSLWPRSHGIREANDGLGAAAVTLAEVFHEAGYGTYGVQTNGWLDQSFGFHQGFERYTFPRGAGARRLARASVWPHADRVVEEAFRLIENHDSDRPMFLYLHFMDVHEFAAPPEFKTFGTDTRGNYLAATRWVDDAIERVRKKLDEAGYLDQAILVFAADHGETFGEHGVHGHARNVLTPVIAVPLVLRLPFAMEATRVSAQVRNLDIAPTLLELAGVGIPPSFEGRSLLTLATGEPDGPPRVNYAALGQPLFTDAKIQTSLSDGTWTYARNTGPEENPQPPELLFDRRVDPGENVNLIGREAEQADLLRTALDAHLETEGTDVRDTNVRIDPGIADRLRAMGYLQ